MSNKYFKEIEYKEVNKKLVYNGKRVQVEELKYLNGDKVIYREHVKAGNASVILPITEDNKVIMIQEARTPIGKVILALPAGMIEEGEKASVAAIRELEEETGYLASDIELLREYYPSVGYSDEKISLYLATNMKKTKQRLDDEENIKVIEVPLEELIEIEKRRENRAKNVFKLYVQYLASLEDKSQAMRFSEFARLRHGLSEDDLPYEYTDEEEKPNTLSNPIFIFSSSLNE